MAERPDTESIDLETAITRLSERPVPVRTTSPDFLRQLGQASASPVKRIICIGIDPDPEVDILSDVRRTRAAEIDAGLKLLLDWFGVMPLRIDAHSPATVYPNLLPAMLVRRLSRKRLAHDAMPTEAGVLILDVLTAANLASLVPPPPGEVRWGRRASIDPEAQSDAPRPHPASPGGGGAGTELPIVVDDHILQRRFRATIAADSTVGDVLAMAGICSDNIVLRHGPLLAEAAASLTTPIDQTDLWIHVLSPTPVISAACTRCGECVTACPVRIHPAALLEAAQRDNEKMARKFHAEACIDCGLCTAVCPSSLPVMAGVIAARRTVIGTTLGHVA